MFPNNTHIVLFDTEYTSWEGAMLRNWTGENEHREMIQVGAVRVRTDTLEEVDSLVLYVKPVINPTLSPFITDLTGVTQEDVDTKGITLAAAIDELDQFTEGSDLYSWGPDGALMIENCRLLKMNCAIKGTRFFDIRALFTAKGIEAKDYMSSTISTAFGIENPARGHDALGDARGILIALKELAKNF